MDKSKGLTVVPLCGMPLFQPGMSIAMELVSALRHTGEEADDSDILVIAQKIVSKAEGATLRLSDIIPSAEAERIAAETRRLPEMIQAILDESQAILRSTQAAIIARHRSGHVLANAGIDASNVAGGDEGTILLWPRDPDASARAIRTEIARLTGKRPAVMIADSMGRAWRIGTTGTAIGCAGLTILEDQRGKGRDLYGRTLQATVIGVADSIAAAAVLTMGEGAEGTPAALVRGAGHWVSQEDGPGAVAGLRPVQEDMFQ